MHWSNLGIINCYAGRVRMAWEEQASIKAASKIFQSIFQTTGGKPPLLMLFTKNTRDELVFLISVLACTDFFPSYLGDLVFSLLGL